MSEAEDTPSEVLEVIEDNRLRRDFIDAVEAALDADDGERVNALVGPLHPADIADLFELIPGHYRRPLAEALGDRVDADVLAEMNDWVRDELIGKLSAGEVAEVVSELDTDDAVAIVEDLDADEQREVLRALDPDDRAAIEAALSFPEESAGRLMQRELVAVPEHWTVGQVIDFLAGPDQPTDFWEIFVVDPGYHPVGTMPLSWLLTAPREVAVTDVMKREQTLIPVDLDQEEVAYQFQKYALISAAVVDKEGRLVGVITVDDIVHIIQQEAGEDALKLSGAGDGDINEPILDTYKVRVVWLILNLGTAMISAFVISMFEATIAQMVTLAALMPIVASIGGNAGTQTMAVAVRALATNQLAESNTWRAIGREIRIALLNGVSLAALIGAGVALVFGIPLLSLVIAVAMLLNILIAGIVGVAIPLTLDRAGADPAVGSSVFVTMCTDVMGFLVFLGLATVTGLAAHH